MTPLHLYPESTVRSTRGWPPLIWKVVACCAAAMALAVVLMAWKVSHEPRLVRPHIEVHLCPR